MIPTTTTTKRSTKHRHAPHNFWSTALYVRRAMATFVLEVLGSAGAIWGCSEALGWRTSSTLWFWRPAALLVGLLFGVRWLVGQCGCCCLRHHPFELDFATTSPPSPESEISMQEQQGDDEDDEWEAGTNVGDTAVVESDLLLHLEYGATV